MEDNLELDLSNAFHCTLSTDDDFPTETSEDQFNTESAVAALFSLTPKPYIFAAEKTAAYLMNGIINGFGPGFVSLDASQPWFLYWSLSPLDTANYYLPKKFVPAAVKKLASCWTKAEKGAGFAGHPFGVPHLMPTFAGISALALLGFDVIPEDSPLKDFRRELMDFLLSVKQKNGSFVSHVDGECDMRCVYAAICSASISGILNDELADNVGNWVASCQTYEGGIAGFPGAEAHGGYTYCALATLNILGCPEKIDRKRCAQWLAMRQMRVEGGYQGRTNKLVDTCYTFWQGASAALLAIDKPCPLHSLKGRQMAKMGKLEKKCNCLSYAVNGDKLHPLNAKKLIDYVLVAGTDERGGLRDKPGKFRDTYHTCYGTLGLSVAQHYGNLSPSESGGCSFRAVNAAHGISHSKFTKAFDYFSSLPSF